MSRTIKIIAGSSRSRIQSILSKDVIRAIHNKTSYELPDAHHRGIPVWKNRQYLFKEGDYSFPSGLLKRVKRVLRKKGYKTKTKDLRKQWAPNEDHVLEMLDSFSACPRDYQAQGIVKGLEQPYGLFWWPTGSGKTVLFSALIRCYNLPTLILTHRQELLFQLQEEISNLTGEEVGIIGAGHFQPKKWTVGIVNSLMKDNKVTRSKEALKFLRSVEYLITDECFVAGTKISIPGGVKNIEDIRVGDIVKSFDVESEEFVDKRVVRLFKKKPSYLCKVRIGGITIICTPNHKFWTRQGWRRADHLSCSDMVLCAMFGRGGGCEDKVSILQDNDRENKESRQRAVHEVSSAQEIRKAKEDQGALHRMRKIYPSVWPHFVKAVCKRESILFRKLQEAVDEQVLFKNNSRDKSEVCIGANEEKQPDAQSSHCGEDEAYAPGRLLGLFKAWREWQEATATAKVVSECAGLAYRSSGEDWPSLTRAANALQNRHRERDTEDSNRGRRSFAPWHGEKSTRSEEGQIPSWQWVDSIEVQEQTSDGTFGGVCAEGNVYNFEVEDTHTYQVEGVVVSNCHHLGANSWWKIANYCKNTRARHGFSGTCFRSDNADLLLLAHTGDIISHYTPSQLIRWGWLSKPYIYTPRVGGVSIPSKTSWQKVERLGIQDNRARNRICCDFIFDRYEEGDQILAMVKLVEHGNIVKKMLIQDYGVEDRDVRYMSGGVSREARKHALEDFKYGVYPILIGTSIYNEGVDLPTIGSAVNMAGGGSEINTTQRLGRAIRKTREEGSLDVDPDIEQRIHYIDPFDMSHRFTRKHSRQRCVVYEREDEFEMMGDYEL